jgi:predicted nucleic acid-binding protein
VILVDKSVWIRALANREPYKKELDELLGRREVAGHEFVCGELIVGDPGGGKKFLADYAGLPVARLVPHHDVVALVTARGLNGRALDRRSPPDLSAC